MNLSAQKSQQKNSKSPATAFLDDVYQLYSGMGSVFTFRTTVYRDRVQSVRFDKLWDNLNIDPSALGTPYKAFISTLPFAVFTTDFRFSPVKSLGMRVIYTFQPVVTQDYINTGYAPYSFQKFQVGSTVNIAETFQLSGDFTYTSSYLQTRFSNNQGFVINQNDNAGDKQGAIGGSYNHRVHVLSFELKQLKNLFFEPRLKIDWVNDQFTYFRSAEMEYDHYVRSGNTSEPTDGFNGENEKNFVTLSTGFTLRPFNNLVLSTRYALTPSLLETRTAIQSFITHSWSISLDIRFDRHFRLITSFSINRSESRLTSPYESFFWDNTYEPQDPAANANANTRARSLAYYNERNVDLDSLTLTVEYR